MKKRTYNIIVLICVLLMISCVISFVYIYVNSNNRDFVYNQHLDDTVFTIRENSSKNTGQNPASYSVSLRDFALFIIESEGIINDLAIRYNSANPRAYWNVHIKSNYYMVDYAKDMARDNCIRYYIFFNEAKKNNITLSDAELKQLSDDVTETLKNMSAKAMDFSEYDYSSLYKVESMIYTADKYISQLTDNGYDSTELNIDGDFYKKLKKSYSVSTDDKLFKKIVLGHLSIE